MSKPIGVNLPGGFFVAVDESDLPNVLAYKWLVKKAPRTFYAYTKLMLLGRMTTYTMHRLIVDPPPDLVVDHINGNGLDNRRANLRACTRMQNSWNQRLSSRNTSGYKGVSWNAQHQRWAARLYANKTLVLDEYFDSAETAYKAYCAAAKEHFGEFARLQ